MQNNKTHHKSIIIPVITLLMLSLMLIGNKGVAQANTALSNLSAPSEKVIFPNAIAGATNSWDIAEIGAVVPSGVSDGDVTVQTVNGTSNGSPFVVGSSFTPSESGEAATWSTTFSGNLATDITWDQNILITGDVTVPAGVTLTINPGVTVFFEANSDDQSTGYWTDKAELHVFGTLTAEGLESDPIYFTSNAATKAPNDWGAINIRHNSTTSSIANCVVHYAKYGVRFYSTNEGSGTISGTVRNCTIAHNTFGLDIESRPDYPSGGTVTLNPTIANNLITNNTQSGIDVTATTGYGTANNYAVIQNNVVSANGTFGIIVDGTAWWLGHADNYPQIINNTIKDHTNIGLWLRVRGSNDSSGSDYDSQPTVENNLIDNNDVNILIELDPKGTDGTQLLQPTIRYNTIRNGSDGIQILDTEPYDTINPTISDNVFLGDFSNYAINNTTSRSITANDNYWGDTEAKWDAGPQAADTNGTVTSSSFLNSTSAPVLSRVEPASAQTCGQVTMHGANFSLLASSSDPFSEFQAIPTSNATDWEHFTIGTDHYLAVANSWNYDAGNFNADSKIYKWNGCSFEPIQTISTNQARDWEHFTIGSDHYLVVANFQNNSGYNLDSKIYKWNGSAFVEFQAIPTKGAFDWQAFSIGSDHFLAVANYWNGVHTSIDSKIYKWNGASFVEFQAIATHDATSWEFFTIGSNHFLAVSNTSSTSSTNINSIIYQWNGSAFVEFQAIPTTGAQDWEYFTISTEHFLAVANDYNSTTGSHHNDSNIYKWNGSVFVEIQAIPTYNATDWEFFSIGADHFLAVTNAAKDGPIYNIDSKIYKWNGATFDEFQAILTYDAQDWQHFTIDDTNYLVVTNYHDGTTGLLDSKIYKWNGSTNPPPLTMLILI